jgi:ribosome biogenesis protein YTM1
LTGSYDRHVRIWKSTGQCLVNIAAHEAAIKCIDRCVYEGKMHVISGALDHTLRVHQIADEALNVHNTVFDCKGHSGSVDCMAVNPSNTMWVSGSWDRVLHLWSMTSSNEEEMVSSPSVTETRINKRRRIDSDPHMVVKKPVATMTAHLQAVTCVAYPSLETVYSGGYDQCIRIWDTLMNVNVRTLDCDQAVLSMSHDGAKIASGHPNGLIRIWDARTSEGLAIQLSLQSHRGWVSSIAWLLNQKSSIAMPLLLSGSYDETVKLWDLRSTTTPVYTLKTHHDKILSVSWTAEPDSPHNSLILSGGADNKLCIHKLNNSI